MASDVTWETSLLCLCLAVTRWSCHSWANRTSGLDHVGGIFSFGGSVDLHCGTFVFLNERTCQKNCLYFFFCDCVEVLFTWGVGVTWVLSHSDKSSTYRCPHPPGQGWGTKALVLINLRYFARTCPPSQATSLCWGYVTWYGSEGVGTHSLLFLSSQAACLNKGLMWIFWGAHAFPLDFVSGSP